MALYAVEEDDLIHAADAKLHKVYWCLECFGPVKKRQGRKNIAHFYHLKAAPTCRLYSKTEDHLLAQLQLQKQFPPTELSLEKPFPQISRVADACWECRKIIFEIQCSPITEKEVEKRISDYRSVGYETIWLLDDKRYNKRLLRPAESFLRRQNTYYLCIKKAIAYDQFEVFAAPRRVLKGKQLPLKLHKISPNPNKIFTPALTPKQILQLETRLYIEGDRLHSALKNHALTLLRWRSLELQIEQETRETPPWLRWLKKYVTRPYAALLEYLLK